MTDLSDPDLFATKVFRALGDPTRYRIVQMLAEQGELSCGELQASFPLSAPALSHHFRILQDSGLIAVRKEGTYHFFRLRREVVEKYAPTLMPKEMSSLT